MCEIETDTKTESAFVKEYYNYFLWNQGLVDYYLNDKSGKEILLYVDEKVLEHIGKKADINSNDYRQHFIESVEDFCKVYNKYVCPERKPNHERYCTIKNCRYYNLKPRYCVVNRQDVLAIANHICSKQMTYWKRYEDENKNIRIKANENNIALPPYDMPFFAIVIYVILKFDNGRTQQWENVGEGLSHQFIDDLWAGINDMNEYFDPKASVYERSEKQRNDYVGKIKYHLPLSAPVLRVLKEAIYKSNVWRYEYKMPFADQVNLLKSSLTNSERDLSAVLEIICKGEDDYGAYSRRVRDEIEKFDVEKYELERKKDDSTQSLQTITTGNFVLAIYTPKSNENGKRSIRLLTTVRQDIEDKGYKIIEGSSNSIAGEYNTYSVEYNGSKEVKIEKHDLHAKGVCRISSMPIDDVVFFYKYNDTWYIQTRTLKQEHNNYIIAVRNDEMVKTSFDNWCKANDNFPKQIESNKTKELFGEKWVIYYSDSRLNGQYYPDDIKDIEQGNDTKLHLGSLQYGGGIKNEEGKYFITALPYIENISDVKDEDISVTLFDYNHTEIKADYQILRPQTDQVVVDFLQMPKMGEGVKCRITLRTNEYEHKSFVFDVCSQDVHFDQNRLYKFNRTGKIVENATEEYILSGNIIKGNNFVVPHIGYTQFNMSKLNVATRDTYFVNLLAACCYNKDSAEIDNDLFEKCLRYLASRLKIDLDQDEFDYYLVKWLLCVTGYINMNYKKNTVQILPPAFTKVPVSVVGGANYQLYLLSGCYTARFLANLKQYCEETNVCIYQKLIKIGETYKGLIPPMILLGHNFSARDFVKQYHHQCDILGDQDVAQSLLNSVSTTSGVFEKFAFDPLNDLQLEDTDEVLFPRMRKTKGKWYQQQRFIESTEGVFCRVADKALIPWAKLYCHINQGKQIIQDGTKLYIPQEISLPWVIRRALYLMNLGLPETIKAFVCNSHSKQMYSNLNVYDLYSEERCNLLFEKLGTGIRRDRTNPKNYSIEFWNSKDETSKSVERYLVLRDNGKIQALGYNRSTYICVVAHNVFCKVIGDMNSVLSWMISTENWQIDTKFNALKVGQFGEGKYNITQEMIELPSKEEFNIEPLKII